MANKEFTSNQTLDLSLNSLLILGPGLKEQRKTHDNGRQTIAICHLGDLNL